jgi:cysteine dioxygenase
MDNIDSLEDLVEALDNAKKKDVPEILKSLQLKKEDLNKYASWATSDYTRNCVMRTDTYELILICWDANSETPIHDHGGQDCWVYQAAGELTEIRFAEENGDLVETNRMTLKPNGLTYMEDTMGYHQLINENKERGYTLHLYAKPIDECEVFNEDKQCFETKEMVYDTHIEVIV